MADQARVTAVEAIEGFRSQLIVFLSKARPTLEEASSELIRTRQWLQNDQRRHWMNEMRLRTRKLERAQNELFDSKLTRGDQASAAQQMAVLRAREAVREAETKLAAVKKWERELENRADPLVKQIEQLQHYFSTNMAAGVAHLAQIVRTLDAYADVLKPGSSVVSPGGETRQAGTEGPPAQPDSPGGGKEVP